MRQYYRRVFKKYCQLKLRIAQNMSNGRFYQQSKKRQAQLLNRLKRYALNLERHGKFLTRCSLLGSVALFSQGLAAQSFTEVTNVASPFIYVNTNPDIPFGLTETVSRSNLDFVDIDGDGDLDAFVGENSGRIQYFENISTDSTFPDFVLRSTDNAFGITGIDSNADPEFVDIDKDGDFDLFSGDLDGTIYFFENIGDTDAPTFIQQTGLDNPFDGVDVGSYSKPTFADTDGDGDLDAFVGTSSGDLFFYENLESVTGVVPSFETDGVSNPFGFVRTGVRANPDLIDIDGDNDLDLFVGISSNRPLRYYENTSTDSTIPAFAAPVEDFFGLGQNSTSVDLNGFLAPKFVDIDSDGDFDLFTGNSNGTTSYYQNTATDSSIPAFQGVQLDIEDEAVPEFVDIDGDGDLDLFVGEEDGYLNYFENISTDPNSPEFIERSTNNAFGIPYVYLYTSPEFVDIDCDGDLDALIGEYYGQVQYYQNTSTDSAIPAYTLVSSENAFGLSSVGYYASPAFIDIDLDGDLDVFIGNSDGDIAFFRNTGANSSIPEFSLISSNNPFGLAITEGYADPTFKDIDGDGDWDAFVGDEDGNYNYFENISTDSTEPLFSLSTNTEPFGLTNVGSYIHPTFEDVDNDGLLEAIVGASNGRLFYFESDIKTALVDIDCKKKDLTLLFAPLQSGVYSTQKVITSRSTIATDTTVTFTAANAILLKSGFEAQNGSTFTAKIEDCTTLPVDGDESVEQRNNFSFDTHQSSEAVHIFPVPVGEQLYISNGIGQARIFDLLGRELMSFIITHTLYTLEVSRLQKGQYVLHLQKEDGTIEVTTFVK